MRRERHDVRCALWHNLMRSEVSDKSWCHELVLVHTKDASPHSVVLANAFEEAGLRALVGKVNMDQNSPRYDMQNEERTVLC